MAEKKTVERCWFGDLFIELLKKESKESSKKEEKEIKLKDLLKKGKKQ